MRRERVCPVANGMRTGVGAWLLAVAVVLGAREAAAQILYDYANRSQGSDIFAYDGESTTQVPVSSTTPANVLNWWEYNRIEYDDGWAHTYWVSRNARYAQMRFVIEIDEDEADVTEMSVIWKGRGINGHFARTDGASLYIWNYTAGSYTLVEASADTQAWVTLSGTLTTNLDDYLGGANDDTVTLLVVSNDKRTGNQFNLLQTDYLSLSITASGVDHFLIGHDGAGVHCVAEPITATAKSAAGDTITGYAGAVTLDTQSGTGTWALGSGSGSFLDATSGDGLATYTFAGADNGVATFVLTYTQGSQTINVDAYATAAPSVRDDDTEGDIAFSPSGFVVTANALSNPPPSPIVDPIATQTAGSPFALHITAYGTTPTDPVCGVIESYTGSQSLKFWSTYGDPASGTLAASIDGSPVAIAEGSAMAQTVVFASGQAAVTAKYKDVGQIRISTKDDAVAEPAGGIAGATNLFVVRPADFWILAVERPDASPNPGASSPSGTAFVAAGAPFRVTVEVRDSEGDRTPNYGNESSGEGILLTASALIAPAGGRNGSNDDGAVGNGSSFSATAPAGTFTGVSFSWDEVGAIRLRAAVADGDYLGSGDVLGSESGTVGRFMPSDFAVAVDTAPVFATGCGIGGFTYAEQPFVYSQAPVLSVTARAVLGTTTRNYTGAWWKITNASLGDPTYASDPATLDASGLPDPATDPSILDLGDGTGTLTFDAGTGLRFDRSSPIEPFDGELSLSIDVIDEDGVAYGANPFQVGSATPGGGIAFSTGKEMRYGRLVLENAYDSELITLPVPLRAEYFVAGGFVPNTDDGCTAVGAADVGTTARSPGALATTPSVANVPLLNGAAGLTLSPPGQDGYADLLVNLSDTDVVTPWGTIAAAGLPWLRFDWLTDGAGAPDDNPTARATFGIYAGQRPVIFRREVY